MSIGQSGLKVILQAKNSEAPPCDTHQVAMYSSVSATDFVLASFLHPGSTGQSRVGSHLSWQVDSRVQRAGSRGCSPGGLHADHTLPEPRTKSASGSEPHKLSCRNFDNPWLTCCTLVLILGREEIKNTGDSF